MNTKQLTVLIAPLNWGLGHATRCIPVITELLQLHYKVIICGNGDSFTLLKMEFPALEHIELPNLAINYPHNSKNFGFSMLRQLPRFLKAKRADHQVAKELYKQYNPDVMISDNRYGFYHKSVISILITHQVEPILPSSFRVFNPIFRKILFSWMKKFNHIWVPDFENIPSLSGKLSHHTRFKGKLTFCGPLSRFSKMRCQDSKILYSVLAIISGPEPQRTAFQKQCEHILQNASCKAVIIGGKPSDKQEYTNSSITYYSHLDAQTLFNEICKAEIIFARAGYSTIMDVFVTSKNAILVPTPGQTEQLYLAHYLSHHPQFMIYHPEKDDFNEVLTKMRCKAKAANSYNGMILREVMKELTESFTQHK